MPRNHSILLLCILFAFPVLAETVILKNKQILKGTVVGQNQQVIELKINGKIQIIPKTTVLKVVYKDLNHEEADTIRKQEEEKLRKKEEIEKKRKAEQEAKLAEEKKKEKERMAAEKKNAEKLLAEKEAIASKKQKHKTTNQIFQVKNFKSPIFKKSILRPGLGLVYADKQNSGYAWTSVFVLSLVNANSQYSHFKQSKSEYQHAFGFSGIVSAGLGGQLNPSQPGISTTVYFYNERVYYNNYKNAGKQLNSALSLAALIYLLQLSHAWIVAGKTEAKDNSSVMRNVEFGVLKESLTDSSGKGSVSQPFVNAIENKTYFQYNWYF